MNSPVIPRVFAGALPSQEARPFRLYWRSRRDDLDGLLLVQRIDIQESLCGGIEGQLACISTTAGIPLETFLGEPVMVQMMTDRGDAQPVCGIVTDAYEGESDGGLASYRLVMRDGLSVLERRMNFRIFRNLSVVDIVQSLVQEWCSRSSTLAGTFDLDVSLLDRSQYPVREQTLQIEESDADFIRRLCRRDGISWFVRSGQAGADNSRKPFHSLVLFDNTMKLERAKAGTVAYRPDATTGARDALTLLCMGRQLVPGSIRRASWNAEQARMDQIQGSTRVDQGAAGNDLAQLLSDVRLDPPHMAESWADYDRKGRGIVAAHSAASVRANGASGVRDLGVCCWVAVTGHPELDRLPEAQRRIMVTSLHHRGENNLPKDLNERAQALFDANRWAFGEPPVSVDTPVRPAAFDGTAPSRYENTFSGVPRSTPLTPQYDPRVHLPRVHPITGVVTVPDGEEVYCTERGDIYVQIQGLDAADHADGAGTSGTPRDSASVRVLGGWAGDTFGGQTVLRKGMEVQLDFANGDPDRMYVAGVFSNGSNMPAAMFSRTGDLPGNRYLSGMRSQEIKGQRHNQLRLDDTPSQISAQLSSEHGFTQLNLGYLTHPRENGQGTARGEGAELRTDAAAALRAAQGILLTTYARSQASGNQLDRDELVRLLGECTELFKSLGDYAGQHGGQAADTAGQDAVATAFKGWQAGGGSGSEGTSGAGNSQALMAFGAQSGSVNVTPKTHVTYAGGNIDQVAQQHVQVTGGQRINLHAGHGVSVFAQSEDFSAIANQGKVRLQSQAGDTQIDSAKNILLTAAGGKLAGTASDQVVFVTSGGAYLKLHGGDIELGCPGNFVVKAAGHQWGGAASMSADLPTFDNAPLGRVPQLVRASDGKPVSGFEGEVRTASGQVVKGVTDSNGKLTPLSGNQFESFVVNFFKKTS
ncbi:type VI secretion system Vgr family protein [Burkholderia ubonensis]|uniref:Type IV secretion protein Rhs n=1 Tax=Burkholderia ubonensis TaxID=101571 RepID=A0ABD6Q6Q6_9BURK|nr:type VI secretion system Vgr family protein [Burkholderia ubonensis]OJA48522.1 type IV secretion protein Rhs [Burkholderia ubonensis]